MRTLIRFTLVLLVLVFSHANAQKAVNQTASTASPKKNLVLLISIDGFRNDYLNRGITPNLLALANQGAHAKNFEPVFPSITFPNHYSQVTGLYPDHNGMVNNTMYDPAKTEQVFKLSDRNAIENPLWWEEGTPLWVTIQKQGKISSTLFWVGSEAVNHGMQPTDWLRYDNNLNSLGRAQQLLRWLDRPDQSRADFAASAKIQWTGPLAGYDVSAADKPVLLNNLKQDSHLTCWSKEAMPAKYHFGTHRRIPQVVCLAQAGWSTIAKAGQKVIPGQHGYDPVQPDMQGLFIAQGPQINKIQLDTVKNIDIYNLLVHLLNVTGEKNDGDDKLYEQIKK